MKKINLALLAFAVVFQHCYPRYFDTVREYPDEISGSKMLTLACQIFPEKKFTGVRSARFVFEKTMQTEGNSVVLVTEFFRNRTSEMMDSVIFFVIDEKRFSLPLLDRKTADHSMNQTQVSGSILAGSETVQSSPMHDEWTTEISRTLLSGDLLLALLKAKKVRVLTHSGERPVSMIFSKKSVRNLEVILKK